jgi:hypothetical protein
MTELVEYNLETGALPAAIGPSRVLFTNEMDCEVAMSNIYRVHGEGALNSECSASVTPSGTQYVEVSFDSEMQCTVS